MILVSNVNTNLRARAVALTGAINGTNIPLVGDTLITVPTKIKNQLKRVASVLKDLEPKKFADVISFLEECSRGK